MQDPIDELADEIVELFPITNALDYRKRLHEELFNAKDKSNQVARMIRDAGIEVWQAMRDDEDADKFMERIIELEKENKQLKSKIIMMEQDAKQDGKSAYYEGHWSV